MRLSFRWFGEEDPVPLEHIRQIPGVHGIVSALYDVPVGATWPRDRIDQLIEIVGEAGMLLSVIESIPVHEEIKLGTPNAEKLLDEYAASVRNIGGRERISRCVYPTALLRSHSMTISSRKSI
jgi:mannonate dehydratase